MLDLPTLGPFSPPGDLADRMLGDVLNGGPNLSLLDSKLPSVCSEFWTKVTQTPEIDLSQRRVPQGSVSLLTIKLPPPCFLTQRIVRSACSLLRSLSSSTAHPLVDIEFLSHKLASYPSAKSPCDTTHALVPTTALDDTGLKDLVVRVRTSMFERAKTFLVPVNVRRFNTYVCTQHTCAFIVAYAYLVCIHVHNANKAGHRP